MMSRYSTIFISIVAALLLWACEDEKTQQLLPTYMEFKIEGDQWRMQGVRPDLNTNDAETRMTVSGTSTNTLANGESTQLSFTIYNFQGPGLYQVKPDTLSTQTVQAFYTPDIENSDSLFTTLRKLSLDTNAVPGEVNVSSWDSTTGVLKGTFSFVVANRFGEELTISNGEFEAK